MLGILASRLLGVVRDAVISGKFGQGRDTDIYNAAFTIPDFLFFLIAGGALSSAFIPVYTEKITLGKRDEANRVFSVVATVMLIVVAAFVVVCEIFAPQLVRLLNFGFPADKVAATVPLTRVVLPAQICFFLGGALMGVQNANRRFSLPALGPVIYNLGIIFGGVALSAKMGVAGLVWGALGGAVVGNLLLQWYGAVKAGLRCRPSLDWHNPDAKRVWKLMLPVIFGLALPQVSLLINRMFASSLGDGPQSALVNANKLMQIPLGVFAQAMAVAIFPTLSALAAERKMAELRSTSSAGIRSILFLTIPSSIALVVLGRPVIALLLQHGRFGTEEASLTSGALAAYSVGIFAWSAQSVLARTFYALQDTRTPVLIGTGVTLVFVPLNWLLMSGMRWGANGLALATSIAAILHMGLMVRVLSRRLEGLEGMRIVNTVTRTTVASLLAGAAAFLLSLVTTRIWPLSGVVGHELKIRALISLLVPGGCGALLFLFLARQFRIAELKMALEMLRRKRRGNPPAQASS